MRISETIVLAVLIQATALAGSEAADRFVGMRVYSDMNYTPLEGEYTGLQVAIVPYSGGQKILWRSGTGPLNPPLMLDVTRAGNLMKVVVPDSDGDMSGDWTLSLDGKVLHARAKNLHFDLKEVPSK